jgi:diguanylate cyclase (GGDEF)-like protein
VQVVRVDLRDDGTIELHVLLIGVVLIVLVITRQILTFIENQHLTKQLRVFNSTLELLVVRRTDQLTALLHLTKSVNNTLQLDQVVAAALANVQQALHADAVTIHMVNEEAADQIVHHHIGLEDQPELVAFVEGLPLRDQTQALALPSRGAVMSGAAYLRAPLRWQQRMIGVIGVARLMGDFNDTETEMLESIGVEVGTAIENARLYAAAIAAADAEPVTGLFNHRAIHQRLEDEFALAALYNRPLTVMMLDLDNFKRFNDTYGHPVGDQVLKTVARILQAECRDSDIVGRYGGDEFMIVLPNTGSADAYNVALRLRTAMVNAGFRRNDEHRTVPVTLSLGLATYPDDCSNRHELLMIADANLYAAKDSDEGIRGMSVSQRTNRQLRTEGTFEVLDAMVTAVDNKDRYTRRHSEDVTDYALWIGEEMRFSEETMRVIRIGCLLHDVGKIGVPDDILRKPGRLTAEEYETMKRHPRLGALIVGALPGMEAILDIVRSHHERWDGKGYPEELGGEDIPLLGRVTAIADAFSAMTTDRPYRKGLDWIAALEEIRAHSGTQFDPRLTQAFVKAVRRRMRTSFATASASDVPTSSHRLKVHEYLQQTPVPDASTALVEIATVASHGPEATRTTTQ